MSQADAAFSERAFYLQEFRGRTLGVACPAGLLRDPDSLTSVVHTLARNDTRVIVISSRRDALTKVVGERIVPASTPRLETSIWRAQRQAQRLGILIGGRRPFTVQCRELALRLGFFKLIWIHPQGGVRAPGGGERLSFVHQDELRSLLAHPRRIGRERRALLREIDRMLAGGIQAVNVCTLDGLDEELFTYSGSGTLFTRKRYIAVRDLGLDDFDAAYDLIGRGVRDGTLAPRPAKEIDRILATGFGAFVEGSHLSGIGALLPHDDRSGEIASLYTLTRFLGEGVGQHLVRYALRLARAQRLRSVFACTTQERVGLFFERQGFDRVSPDDLPASKWRRYDRRRRKRLQCYRRELVTRRRRRPPADA